MLDELRKILEVSNPKSVGGILKRNDVMRSYILSYTSHLPDSASLSERAYLLLNPDSSSKCPEGKDKRFISITKGHGFCDKTSKCICAKESVSRKVSETKKSFSTDENLAINQKRAKTNLQRYGVTNAGQTEKAKSNHSEFYSDPDKVSQTVSKMQTTMIDRYGAANPQQVDELKIKSKKTLLERYGVDNINKSELSKTRLSQQSKAAWIKRQADHLDYHRLNDKFRRMNHVEFVTEPSEYKGTVGNIWYSFRCLDCRDEFETWISCGHLPVCKRCHPVRPQFKSGEENEVFDYIKSLGINAYQRDRRLINPHELDIVCPDHKIAVEYCGLYWHSESSNNKDKNYHLYKLQACSAAGYRLITIFSDEWNLKNEIVKSKLSAIFGYASNHMGARNCNTTILSAKDANAFYELHHLQGGVGAESHLGLLHDGSLVAAMSFGKPRTFIKNSRSKHDYELLRYSTSCHVRGGAGKLLRWFEMKHSPRSLISYADARWSNGGMYHALGFKQIDQPLNPGYWYTRDYATREHRFKYTKSSLVKQGHDQYLSEWEIMQSLGYDRIWDCGQLRYEKIY
jgi:hypothetical protein